MTTNNLPQKVEDFLRELFGDEVEIGCSSIGWNYILITRSFHDYEELQSRYDTLLGTSTLRGIKRMVGKFKKGGDGR